MMVKMKPTLGIYSRFGDFEFGGHRPPLQKKLAAVAADRFDRATFHSLFAETLFLGRLGLLVNERVPAVIVAFEIRGRGFAAEIAVDALFIDVEFSGGVLGIFIGGVGHSFGSGKLGGNAQDATQTPSNFRASRANLKPLNGVARSTSFAKPST